MDLLRPARHQVQQPRMHASVVVAAQVDHPGQLLGTLRALVAVVLYVFVDSEARDPREAELVRGEALELGLHHPPQCPPRHAQAARQPGDGGVLTTELPDPPRHRPRGDRAPGRDRPRDLLDERSTRTHHLRAAPDPLPLHHLDPHVTVGRVVQEPTPAAAARGHDPAVRQPCSCHGVETVAVIVVAVRSAASTCTPGRPSSTSQRVAGFGGGGRASPPRSVGQRRSPRDR